MGMEMSAYVFAGKTEEGRNRYDFAPVDLFLHASIVDLEWYKSPTFRLTHQIRGILSSVLQVSFEEGYISFSEEEAIAACKKLKAEEQLTRFTISNFDPVLYRGLIEFFEICIENKYNISAA